MILRDVDDSDLLHHATLGHDNNAIPVLSLWRPMPRKRANTAKCAKEKEREREIEKRRRGNNRGYKRSVKTRACIIIVIIMSEPFIKFCAAYNASCYANWERYIAKISKTIFASGNIIILFIISLHIVSH